MTFLAAFCGGLLGGYLAVRLRRKPRLVESGFHVKHVEPETVIVIPWEEKTAFITSGWNHIPDA